MRAACANTADHEWGPEELVKAATCVETGEIRQVCTKCGVAIKFETTIDPLAHSWSDWTVEQEETCTESGSRSHKCGLCDEVQTEIIEPAGHDWGEGEVTKEATCQHTGLRIFVCGKCGESKTEIIPTTEDHLWDDGTLVMRATTAAPGLRVYVCDVCGRDRAVEIPILKPAVKLTAAAYEYNGKVRTPKVTVTNGGVTMAATQYTVKMPSGRKNVGKYTVTVTFAGDYEGTAKADFVINPKGTSLGKIKPGKKLMTVKWKKQASKMAKARIGGYQIQYSTSKTFKKGSKTVTVKGYKKVSQKVKKLKSRKKYYVRIRTYLKTGGKTYYSKWSRSKAVKIK